MTSTRPNLTVLIPCKDERINIRPCVESVRSIADEILVADSGSTDGTLDLVRQLGGCRIVEREFIDYSSFKNWAMAHAAHSWVLIVDADERVTDQLAAEIRSLFSKTPPLDAYRLPRVAYFLGRRINHSGWNSSMPVRLFRRDACQYNKHRVHESIEVATGRVGKLKGKLDHFTCQCLTKYLANLNRYTTTAAEDMHAAGRRGRFLDFLVRPPLRFLKDYIVRGGFLDGRGGLAVCTISAYYVFLKYLKLWALSTTYVTADEERSGPSSQKGIATVHQTEDRPDEVPVAAGELIG
ncbi:MAG: glycosyltransferase family 2 protein [Planctomycetota bacterium]